MTATAREQPMPDVQAASERLRGGFNYAQCPDHWQECNDARTIAEAWLTEHPAGDPYNHERENGERYAAELDAAAEILKRVHPIGKVKGIGRLEVVAVLEDLFTLTTASATLPVPEAQAVQAEVEAERD